MHQKRVRGLGILAGWAALFLLNGVSQIEPVLAQTACEPPEDNEYLLLIISPNFNGAKQVRQTLPSDIDSEVCQYVDDVVTRVGGFEDRLIAEDWAAYLEDAIGLQAYIVRPDNGEDLSEETHLDSRPPPNLLPSNSRAAFNPNL
jgi:hypothetical protein